MNSTERLPKSVAGHRRCLLITMATGFRNGVWLGHQCTFAPKVVVKVPTLAVTAKLPAMLLAVSVGAIAFPLESVRIGMGGVDANVPLAPFDPGTTVNVTLAPCTPFPAASVTCTFSGVAKGWPAGALWPKPAILVITAGMSAL